ncbi:hypothetical protein KQI79_26905 [Paenibacillus sp. MSJ-34]|nr:hypothetical protein [Paenibacillus sp. MSJ-34]
MTELAVLEERFPMPPEFNLTRYRPPDDHNIRVLVRVKLKRSCCNNTTRVKLGLTRFRCRKTSTGKIYDL